MVTKVASLGQPSTFHDGHLQPMHSLPTSALCPLMVERSACSSNSQGGHANDAHSSNSYRSTARALCGESKSLASKKSEFTAIANLIFPSSHLRPLPSLQNLHTTPDASSTASSSSSDEDCAFNACEPDRGPISATQNSCASADRESPSISEQRACQLPPPGREQHDACMPSIPGMSERSSSSTGIDGSSHPLPGVSSVPSSRDRSNEIIGGNSHAVSFPSTAELLFGQPPSPFCGYPIQRRSRSSWRAMG